MKIFHLSDLHLGKRVNGFSMIDDQKYILSQIIDRVIEQKPQAVIIAGDIYDKPIPPVEAVELFDNFICKLSELNIQTLIISGNHDSAQRVSFASRLIDKSGIHFAPMFDGKIRKINLSDNYGNINFYLLPFIKPINVKKYFSDCEISTYNDAMKIVLSNLSLNEKERNVLVTHQFITGAVQSDSEEISLGGCDNIDATLFDSFDYVALGHIHKPQKITRDTIRYCGTPLKYSFSEVSNKNSITVVEFFEKGNIAIDTIPLTPIKQLQEIKGNYMMLTSKEFYSDINTDNYMHIILTDEEDIFDALGKLRTIYPNIMKLDYDNTRTKKQAEIDIDQTVVQKSPKELFRILFEKQNNKPMNEEQSIICDSLIESIWEENNEA